MNPELHKIVTGRSTIYCETLDDFQKLWKQQTSLDDAGIRYEDVTAYKLIEGQWVEIGFAQRTWNR